MRAVSVVIPTTGRHSLSRAVESALRQEAVTVEVIIVMNGYGTVSDLPMDDRVQVIYNQPRSGANLARQTGIEKSSYEIVCLLDDDDYWLPRKLINQLALRESKEKIGVDSIIGCSISDSSEMEPTSMRPMIATPLTILNVEEYLFHRTSIVSNKPQLQTSTLMFSRSLAIDFPFDPKVKIHQDWQWILDVTRNTNVEVQISEPLGAVCEKGTSGSITSGTNWRDSMDWANRNFERGSKARSDFILTVSLGFAAREKSPRGVVACCVGSIRSGTPSLGAVASAGGQILRVVRKSAAQIPNSLKQIPYIWNRGKSA